MGNDNITITFNWHNYKKAIKSGNCSPPGVFIPFIHVDPKKYNELKKRGERKPNLSLLKERFGEKLFNKVRGASALTLRSARMFFPAYRFLIFDVLHNDWMAAVDGRKPHRDHVIHPPMTAYVGLSLLNGCDLSGSPTGDIKFEGKSLLDHCVEIMATSPECQYLRDYFKKMGGNPRIFTSNDPKSEILRKWMFLDTFFLAALFHDIGYPWSLLSRINKTLKTHAPIKNLVTQDSQWIARHYNSRMLLYPFNGYKEADLTAPAFWSHNYLKLVEKGLSETHGLPGALALLYLNDVLRKYPMDTRDDPTRRFCLEWAAMAVMMHDMAGIYSNDKAKNNHKTQKYDNSHLRLSLRRDPLSFMLTLSDKIQDFERPHAIFKANREYTDRSTIIYDSRCKAVDVKWNPQSGILDIICKFKSMEDYLYVIEHFKKDASLYVNPVDGYLDFSGFGIRKIKITADVISPKVS